MRETGRRPPLGLLLLLLLAHAAALLSASPWSPRACGLGGCGLARRASEACGSGIRSGCCGQQPIKCCDPSCPKCLGGRPPRPGSGCAAGCPLGGCCPGTCPCEDCVCCVTATALVRVTSTCYAETVSTRIFTETRRRTVSEDLTLTTIVPVTFSVDEIFLFTSTLILTSFATAPTFVSGAETTVSILSQSTIFFTTISLTELSTSITAPATTITTDVLTLQTTMFVSVATGSVLVTTDFTSTVNGFYTTILTAETIIFPVPGNDFNFTRTITATVIAPTFDTFLVTALSVPTTRLIPPQTQDATFVATTSVFSITSLATQVYSTPAFSTVSGTGTIFAFTEVSAGLTLVATTDGFAVSSTRVQSVLATITETIVDTVNICPTRTLVSGTATVFQLVTESVTTAITTGTTVVISTINSTIVFD